LPLRCWLCVCPQLGRMGSTAVRRRIRLLRVRRLLRGRNPRLRARVILRIRTGLSSRMGRSNGRRMFHRGMLGSGGGPVMRRMRPGLVIRA
jgi:hypothetical protein